MGEESSPERGRARLRVRAAQSQVRDTAEAVGAATHADARTQKDEQADVSCLLRFPGLALWTVHSGWWPDVWTLALALPSVSHVTLEKSLDLTESVA